VISGMPRKSNMIDIDAMQKRANEATSLLSAMCNEKRLMILCQLIDSERTVNELAKLVGAPQPTVSQHLGLLRRERLINVRQDGRTRFYSLAGNEAREILGTLQSLYCEPTSKEVK
jgi:ArsR family transcriptional regulator, virulence genes transcriptional regulator